MTLAGVPRSFRPAPSEFPALYRQEFPYVFRTLRRLGVRSRDLDDLTQEVFVVVHQRLSDYDRARPIQPWLFGISFRVASAHRRRWLRRPAEVIPDALDYPDEAPNPEDTTADHQAREIVLEALEGIDLDQRAVFVMHDIDGSPVPEIAAALGISVNTIYSRLRAARDKFARKVKRIRARRGDL